MTPLPACDPPTRRWATVSKLYACKRGCAILLFCAAASVASPAQTLTTLVDFDNSNNGAFPYASLVQGIDGNLYGTTSAGPNERSFFYKITPSGELTIVSTINHKFFARGAVVQGTDTNFYGTTTGTFFKVTPSGKLNELYKFCSEPDCADGNEPQASLVQGTDGNFYGTTTGGGTLEGGTVFTVTPGGTLTTLHRFVSPEGRTPYGALIEAANGDFYGTTQDGGANNAGTVFRITQSGHLTTLYSFCSQAGCPDGAYPLAGLVEGVGGDFYGTTYGYGEGSSSLGTVFRITPSGKLTTLHSFNGTDGASPTDALVLATDGNFYGTTQSPGSTGGTIFKITPRGTLTTIYNFSQSCTNGSNPYGGLVQATNGNFYGTTFDGGGTHCKAFGTIFTLNVGLDPFVEALPTTGNVGRTVKIMGQGLTSTTAVSFNGIAANFTVKSDTYLTATVPTGATTGSITVATPGGTLTSNTSFRITP